ncbi:SDR family NAD(P)-dependent oxidoreductase [Periweissella beninensis]|uniref:SDR family NAD(P)-dependent oxidoreductase n=1 Tax=Periweissella beninensis TaxID=504936 RepID=UPI0021A3759A|nr:SDR family NAD(P)-dependent oxidoreductase [Periweissella beninensis]MCT4396411.1 SDR family oxidoreductase [Periweissella beninensis]
MSSAEEFSTNTFRLDGKVALITGGASGLGRYYTQALSKSGADIAVVSHSKNGWADIKKIVENNGRQILFIEADVSKNGIATKIIDQVVTEFGHLDILVNNAGIQRRAKWDEFPDEDWQQVIDLNLNAVYHLAKAAALQMKKQAGGKIINIGSMQSYRAGKFIFPYTASKHGVMGLTKAYSDALAAHNIQVNAIAPGYISTPMTQALRDDEQRNTEILGHIPANHWADPAELMGTVVFLASPASNYITGVTLPVDGGYLLR